MGKNFSPIINNIELNIFFQGMRDAANGKGKLTDQEVQQLIMAFQKDMMQRQQEEIKALGEKNKAEGEKFLAENAKKEGVKVTESGLQYEIIKEGTGDSPKLEDKVSVTYRGALLDNTVFDEKTEPITFNLRGMVKGWQEGIPLMKVGSKFRFYIPAELGYGLRAPQKIGPNAVLVFEVELMGINPEPPKSETPTPPAQE